jgi:uncharacterized membrane protein YphA (DoxX/SURF4 family)
VLSWIGTLARLVLGGVFVVAGALKVDDPDASVRAVQAYRLLPTDMAEIVGYILPAVEIGIGLLLLVGLMTRIAALAALVLLVAFVIGVSSAWARGLSIDCGCFGGGGEVAPGQTRYLQELIRDAGLILAAGFLVLRPRSRLSLDRTTDRDGRNAPATEEVAA